MTSGVPQRGPGGRNGRPIKTLSPMYAQRLQRDIDREELEKVRGNVCWICGQPPKKRALHVDHDHKTGRNRGLLCFRHNSLILGARGVTAAELRKCADYLDEAAREGVGCAT